MFSFQKTEIKKPEITRKKKEEKKRCGCISNEVLAATAEI